MPPHLQALRGQPVAVHLLGWCQRPRLSPGSPGQASWARGTWDLRARSWEDSPTETRAMWRVGWGAPTWVTVSRDGRKCPDTTALPTEGVDTVQVCFFESVCVCVCVCVCVSDHVPVSVRVCFRGGCVRRYVMEALPGASKPQWCNCRPARPPEGKEGKCKHHSGPFPCLPRAGPAQSSSSRSPFLLP